MKTLLISVGSTLITIIITIVVANVLIKQATMAAEQQAAKYQAELKQEREQAQQEIQAQRAALVKIAHEIAVPPTNDKLFTITTKGIGITEYEFKGTDSVGTTPEAAFTTDIIAADRTDAWTQQATFHNTDGTDNLCVKPISWASAGGATCQLKCAAATITCSNGVSTDGKFLQPGQEVTRDWDGTSCLCVVGSAAGVTYQTERVLR